MMCFCGHFAQQPLGIVFVHDIDAMTDALGMAEFDGLADVETQSFGGNQARCEFAGVQ